MEPIEGVGWRLCSVQPGEPLEIRAERLLIDHLAADSVLLEVAGCGVCHTDLGFLFGGVKTRKDPPLILGHEISGRVIATGTSAEAERWRGSAVVAPAVIPCGRCRQCERGRRTACLHQAMPGNDFDGGFATHVVVPARWLCRVDESRLGTLGLWQMAVVADAVTTPYQAIVRSGLAEGELAVVVGCGGVGGFAVQIAAAVGAIVVAIDIDPERLSRARASNAAHTIDAAHLRPREVRDAVRACARAASIAGDGWRIFETSGTPAGQQTAFALLTFGGSLSVVGFTPTDVPLRLSNVMAFDAEIYGNWGCDPGLYPAVLDLVLSGRVAVAPHVRGFALDRCADVLHSAQRGEILERPVLIPSGDW
ncbi:MAG: 6-hydroxycyclohex-1-ene-1-carbonyl-CoA dehydrogenase [Candidatus Schekmanbacteria bacterium]|nr:6-hydroxycyclohex-1-ene-1-carbonyl-CoA dehydrogenase [Candidatus Schekmanbacteria bacterium]